MSLHCTAQHARSWRGAESFIANFMGGRMQKSARKFHGEALLRLIAAKRLREGWPTIA
jgi:hypothetical protein